MQEWRLLTTEDRLTLRRKWPTYGRDAWGLGRVALVGGLILLIMVRYASEQGVAHVSWFDWLCLTGSGALTALTLGALLVHLRQAGVGLVFDRTGRQVLKNGRRITGWDSLDGFVMRQVGLTPPAYNLVLVYQRGRQLTITHYSADAAAVRDLGHILSRSMERPFTDG
jgi:hypothetical protein